MFSRRAFMVGLLGASRVPVSSSRSPLASVSSSVPGWVSRREHVFSTFERLSETHHPMMNTFLLEVHETYTLMIDHALCNSYDLAFVGDSMESLNLVLARWRATDDPVYYQNSQGLSEVLNTLALDLEEYLAMVPVEES